MTGAVIQGKRILAPHITLMEVNVPHIAKKAEPGQFVMLRVRESGERIPLTIAGVDVNRENITLVFQEVGVTTLLLGQLEVGEAILDIAGPLGEGSSFAGMKKVAVIGGGLGCAIAWPQAKALHTLGAEVDIIAGFRDKSYVILEQEMADCCNKLHITTDDGSYGAKGFVTDRLRECIAAGNGYDTVIAIGPLPMMQAVSKLTKEFGIKTIVSMNPVMIDGTGMCGGCRLTVGGRVKFACVDGPDFDGHQVDFDEAIRRSKMYKDYEKHRFGDVHCNMKGVENGQNEANFNA